MVSDAATLATMEGTGNSADRQLERLDRIEEELNRLLAEVRGASAEIAAEIARLRVEIPDLAAAPAPAAEAPQRPTPLTEPPVGGGAPEGDVEGARLVAMELLMRGEDEEAAREHLEEAFPGVDGASVLAQTRETLGA